MKAKKLFVGVMLFVSVPLCASASAAVSAGGNAAASVLARNLQAVEDFWLKGPGSELPPLTQKMITQGRVWQHYMKSGKGHPSFWSPRDHEQTKFDRYWVARQEVWAFLTRKDQKGSLPHAFSELKEQVVLGAIPFDSLPELVRLSEEEMEEMAWVKDINLADRVRVCVQAMLDRNILPAVSESEWRRHARYVVALCDILLVLHTLDKVSAPFLSWDYIRACEKVLEVRALAVANAVKKLQRSGFADTTIKESYGCAFPSCRATDMVWWTAEQNSIIHSIIESSGLGEFSERFPPYFAALKDSLKRNLEDVHSKDQIRDFILNYVRLRLVKVFFGAEARRQWVGSVVGEDSLMWAYFKWLVDLSDYYFGAEVKGA